LWGLGEGLKTMKFEGQFVISQSFNKTGSSKGYRSTSYLEKFFEQAPNVKIAHSGM
jgi:hypothetical protein